MSKLAKCAQCSNDAHIIQGSGGLCVIHYRIANMRTVARRAGKTVPTRQEIEALVPADMVCPFCDRAMNWLRKDGISTQATLQHDRSGGHRVICMGCNARHAVHPGDSFYEIPGGHKLCPACNQVLPKERFNRASTRPVGVSTYCRPCYGLVRKKWPRSDRPKSRLRKEVSA